MAKSTQEMREAWAKFECKQDLMERISFGPDSILVAPPTVDAWKALQRVLEVFGYDIRIEDTDSYNCRTIKNGSGRSLHSYGIALDINWKTNPYKDHPGKRSPKFSPKATQDQRAQDVRLGLADTDMTEAMTNSVEAIQTIGGKQVFRWGGNFEKLKDAMHFEINVTPAELATGIDWSKVAGGQTIGGLGAVRPEDIDDDSDAFDIFEDFPIREEAVVALAEGDKGTMVKALQETLKSLNYPVGGIDGDFGKLTRDALMAFQADNGLPTTGVADAATMNALKNAMPRSFSFERTSAHEGDLQKKGSRVINSAGWNRWLSYALAILGGGGLIDSQGQFVSRFGNWLKGAVDASGATPDQVTQAMEAVKGLGPNPTAADLLGLADQVIKLVGAGQGGAASGGTGGIVDSIISLLQSLLGSGSAGPWGMVLAAAYFVFRNANTAAKARLGEHQTGMNLNK